MYVLAELQWIKLSVNTFDDEKIKLIRKMPNGNNVTLIWFMFLTLAGRYNDSGLLRMNDTTPYTPDMISCIFDIPADEIIQAIEIFKQYRMVDINNDIICISNWQKHQHSESIEKHKEQNRQRQQRYRDRQKELSKNRNVTLPVALNNVTVTHTEEEKELEIEKEYNNILSTCVDEFNSICKSFPKIIELTDKRKGAIIKLYDNNIKFSELFKKAEESDFLSGRNGTWKGCTFDWITDHHNAIKVIEGNYDNKQQDTSQNETKRYGGTYI